MEKKKKEGKYLEWEIIPFDEADDLFTELRGIFQALIGMAEENDLPHAQQVGCSDLFLLSSFG
jgi:hypothetical protein